MDRVRVQGLPQNSHIICKVWKSIFSFSFIYLYIFLFQIFKETVKILTNKLIKHRLQWPQMAENTKFMACLGKKNTKKSPENALSFCLMLIPGLTTSLDSEELSQHRASLKKLEKWLFFMFLVFLVWLYVSALGKSENLLKNISIPSKK